MLSISPSIEPVRSMRKNTSATVSCGRVSRLTRKVPASGSGSTQSSGGRAGASRTSAASVTSTGTSGTSRPVFAPQPWSAATSAAMGINGARGMGSL